MRTSWAWRENSVEGEERASSVRLVRRVFIAVVVASFAAEMVVGDAASETGNYGQYLAIAILVAIVAILVSVVLSHLAVGKRRRG